MKENGLLGKITGVLEALEESCFYSLSCELLTFLLCLGYVFYSQGALGAVSIENILITRFNLFARQLLLPGPLWREPSH